MKTMQKLKALAITLLLIVVAVLSALSLHQLNVIHHQTELLKLIHDEDVNTWCDVICETDEYQSLIQIYDPGF